MDARPNILVVTKGHPFEAEPFFAVFDKLDVSWTHVEHPEAQQVLTPSGTESYDAVVMYDMPGITFTGGNPPAVFHRPGEEAQRDYLDMLEAGRGLLFLHHAVASWPAWPTFAEIVGGRFHYQPGTLGATSWPDSGYVFDVEHTVEILEPDHPVCAGLPAQFDIVDELYLFPVLDEQVVPLMRSRFGFTDHNFYSADLAIRGTRNARQGWNHPPGSDLVAWAKHAGNSPICYVQFGDGPATYADHNYRTVLKNAVEWVASDQARRWAEDRRNRLGPGFGDG